MRQISVTSAASSCLQRRGKAAAAFLCDPYRGGENICDLESCGLRAVVHPVTMSQCRTSCAPRMPGTSVCTARILYLVSPNTCSCNFKSRFLPPLEPVKLGGVSVCGRQAERRTRLRGIGVGKAVGRVFSELCAGFP